MLTFSRILSRSRQTKTCGVHPVLRFNNYSSSANPDMKTIQTSQSDSEKETPLNNIRKYPPPKSPSPMVAAAFASLNQEVNMGVRRPITDDKLDSAKTVDEVLSLSDGNGISRKRALKVVSILADWSSAGKIQLADFETDPRFIRLCKILTNGVLPQPLKVTKNTSASRSDDLTTVLSVTADDEAAKLVENITLSQMVKVMSTLSLKKRRSTLLLRTLSFNITKSADQLDMKQCGDLLYSMSILNFLDDNLLSRIANDICIGLEKGIKKSSVVGSILTSIGFLKYKNPVLMDLLSEWVLKNHLLCRPQDINSLFMTLAVIGYVPSNSEKLFDSIIPQMNPLEAGRSLVWLEMVWSLVLLNRASSEHVASILNDNFLENLGDNPSMSTKLKLLNISGAARHLLKDYEGPFISLETIMRNTQLQQTKEKSEMVNAVADSLKSLIQSDQYLRTRVNTGHGFFIDVECMIDKKCSPVPLTRIQDYPDAKRIAIMVYEYHDMCRGKVEPTGINTFASTLLRAQGYNVLMVPYTDFRPRDKLIFRVQYLESKLKEIAKES